MFDNLLISLVEYLKMWNRISLPMLPLEIPPSIRTWRMTKSKAFIVDSLNGSSEFSSALYPLSNYKSPILSHLCQKLSFCVVFRSVKISQSGVIVLKKRWTVLVNQ